MLFKLLKITTISVTLLLAACQKDASESGSHSASSAQTQDLKVLAIVNGESITESDVEFMIKRTFSSIDRMFDSEQLREKVLQSLIASKAMQQSVQKDLSADEQLEIQREIDAYGEELYVKAYLTENTTPEPVTTVMVSDYYQSNPEQFGGGSIKLIELLKAKSQLSEAERESLLASMPVIKKTADWQQYAENNAKILSYLKTKVKPKLLDPSIEIAAKKLRQNEVSNVIFIKGVAHIIRVISIEELAAKPLASVSSSIRKKLAALQLKKAVKKASDEVIKAAKVELK